MADLAKEVSDSRANDIKRVEEQKKQGDTIRGSDGNTTEE